MDMLSSLPRFTQLVRTEARIWIHAVSMASLLMVLLSLRSTWDLITVTACLPGVLHEDGKDC